MTIMQPIMPKFSPMQAKIKSVCLPVKTEAVCSASTPESLPEARVILLCVVCQLMPQPVGSMLESYGASILCF